MNENIYIQKLRKESLGPVHGALFAGLGFAREIKEQLDLFIAVQLFLKLFLKRALPLEEEGRLGQWGAGGRAVLTSSFVAKRLVSAILPALR